MSLVLRIRDSGRQFEGYWTCRRHSCHRNSNGDGSLSSFRSSPPFVMLNSFQHPSCHKGEAGVFGVPLRHGSLAAGGDGAGGEMDPETSSG